ncbi:glutathione S-transferase 1-like isoform X2 [Venturia canescens]|nr:glutathione S-transferase 1-like isoform X2 [Venturia canescens]
MCSLSIEQTSGCCGNNGVGSGRLLRDFSRLSSDKLRQKSFVLQRHTSLLGNRDVQKRNFSDMSRPIVYLADASPPSRSILLAAEAMGLNIDVRRIDLRRGEHLTEEFRKMNPEHTVPTLNDNGFIIWDSHAIMGYLVDKYAKNDTLYPKDVAQRALVNQRLHFDSGVLFSRLRFISYALIMGKTDTVPIEKLELLEEAYRHLNNFLNGKKWLVGDSYTLADISCVTTISSIVCVLPIDEYPHIQAWLKRCEETLPGYKTLNTPGCNLFHKLIGSRITSKGKL